MIKNACFFDFFQRMALNMNKINKLRVLAGEYVFLEYGLKIMVNGVPVIPMRFIFKALNDLYEEFAP